jgi:hypothetical protein
LTSIHALAVVVCLETKLMRSIFSCNLLNETVCVQDDVSRSVSSRKVVVANAPTCDACLGSVHRFSCNVLDEAVCVQG